MVGNGALDVCPIVPVIMCGGAGTRLWPLSTDDKPKPFHAIGSDLSLFQQTVLRVSREETSAFSPPVIVGSRKHRALIEVQLDEIGVTPLAVVLEPFGRGTAAVAALAAMTVSALRPGATCCCCPQIIT
jgi:mannose-1-phosphate guanylyltransferase